MIALAVDGHSEGSIYSDVTTSLSRCKEYGGSAVASAAMLAHSVGYTQSGSSAQQFRGGSNLCIINFVLPYCMYYKPLMYYKPTSSSAQTSCIIIGRLYIRI